MLIDIRTGRPKWERKYFQKFHIQTDKIKVIKCFFLVLKKAFLKDEEAQFYGRGVVKADASPVIFHSGFER